MNDGGDSSISRRYLNVLEQVRQASVAAGRTTPPQVIAVSKFHPVSAIEEAIRSGIVMFGENRIQEGIEKFTIIRGKGLEFELHHIGPLQTGNIKKLFPLFKMTHGGASIHSIQELLKYTARNSVKIDYFFQVNLTGEESKSGIERNELLEALKNISQFRNDFCRPAGLMTMGPTSQDPGMTRNVFRELNQIRKDYFPEGKLSMGMSGDYKIAIEEGSDILRIGTAIFGERE